jgi:hypothetical protein
MSPYDPEQWRDFFMTVGGGAATMTGLAVVAMSLHEGTLAKDPVLLHRARMMLAGLAGVFMRCSVALIGGEGGRALAIELFVVCLVLGVSGLFSYAPVSKTPVEGRHRSSLLRTIGSATCYGAEMSGAALLFAGFDWGLRVAAVAMVANFVFIISGSWLLLLGVEEDDERRAR